MVRFDEQLRIKFEDLAEIVYENNSPARQENLEHRRLILSMRCFISMIGNQLFQLEILSPEEKERIKNIQLDVDLTNNLILDVTNLAAAAFETYMGAISDRKNTERIFRSFLILIYSRTNEITAEEKTVIIDAIINKFRFKFP